MLRRGVMACVALSALVGCERVPPDHLEIVVTDGARPIAGMEVRSGESLLGRTDGSGVVRLDDLRRFGRETLVEVRDSDPLSTLLPNAKQIEIPWAFFPDDIRVEIVLSRIPRSDSGVTGSDLSEPSPQSNRAQTEGGGAPSLTPSELVAPAIAESELPPEATQMPTAFPIITPTPATSTSETSGLARSTLPAPILLATPPQSGVAQSNDRPKEIVAHVFLAGKPVGDAQVFASDNGTRALVQIGTTATDGLLRAPFPAGLKPESLLIRHACCKPVVRPVMAQGAAPTMIVLGEEKGRDFVLMRDLYGFARLFPNTELWSGETRLDLAGESGILLAGTKQLAKGEYSLVNRDAVPEKVSGKISEKDGGGKPVIVYAGSKKAQLPIVGLVEFAPLEDGSTKIGEGKWRRFRREIFTRFVQNQAIRALIPSDVLALSDAAKLKPRELVERGWEFSVVNPSLDFALVLDGETAGSVVAKLVDRSGAAVWERRYSLDDALPPEKRGAEMFQALTNSFPFEGHVTAYADGVATINLNNDIERGLKVGQSVEFFAHQKGSFDGRLSEPAGKGEIVEIARTGTLVRLKEMKLEAKSESWIGVRARRIPGGG